MKILNNSEDLNLILNVDTDFKTDLGWSDSFQEFEDQALKKIINPVENYETVRYIHKPYSGMTSNPTNTQSDIWFYFYFLSGSTYVQNYEATGLTNKENVKMLRQSTESFFRLEFYKTPNNEAPERMNRRLVFSKNLSLPIGEKYYYTGSTVNGYVYLPVFTGSNYRNKENMYLFWFQDETAFNETTLTGNTFWMTARYFNAKDGSISDFMNFKTSGYTPSSTVTEYQDMYYKVEIDKSDFSYQTYEYTGTTGNRAGVRLNPIKFYEKFT